MISRRFLEPEQQTRFVLHAIGAAGVAAILYVAYAIAGATPRADVDGANAAALSDVASRLLATHQEIHSVESQRTSAEARVRELGQRIPADAHETEVLADLTRIARETGLRLDDYETREPIERTGYFQLPIRLIGASDYEGICRFLDAVDRLPRLTSIEDLTIMTTPGTAAYPIDITVAVYFTGRAAPPRGQGGGDG